MIADAVTSIRAYLYEKNSSPLLGSVVVSWLFWNYRMVLLVFSDMKYAEKMAEIDRFYNDSFCTITIKSFEFSVSNQSMIAVILPLLTAAFYLFVYPIPAKKVFEYSLVKQKELREAKQKAEEAKLLDVEESKLLWKRVVDSDQQLAEERERYSRLIAEKDSQISELKDRLKPSEPPSLERDEQEAILKEEKSKGSEKAGESQDKTHQSHIRIQPASIQTEDERLYRRAMELLSLEPPYDEQEETQLVLLSELADSPNSLPAHSLLKRYKNQGKAKFYIDELVEEGLVNRSPNDYYSIPQSVKRAIIKNRK